MLSCKQSESKYSCHLVHTSFGTSYLFYEEPRSFFVQRSTSEKVWGEAEAMEWRENRWAVDQRRMNSALFY